MRNSIICLALLLSSRKSCAEDSSLLDLSLTSVSTSVVVQMLVTDPMGKRTGFLSPSGPEALEIPHSGYVIESIDDDETGEEGEERAAFSLRPVAVGTYSVVIWALSDTFYSLFPTVWDSSGTSIDAGIHLTGFLSAGASHQFTLPYDPTPGVPARMVKEVSFAALRGELQTASSLGQVADARFVGLLDDALTKGQAALDKKAPPPGGNEKEAIAKLRQFINELGSARAAPEPPASDKRRVSAEALTALRSDAQTLIVRLGGKP